MTIQPTPPPASQALYTRENNRYSEQIDGSQVHYANFDDFVTAFHAEANDPDRVGAADFLDVLNPLQHLPLIGFLYRKITGDTIKPGAEMMGDTLFGGGLGLVGSSVKVAVKNHIDETPTISDIRVAADAPSSAPTPRTIDQVISRALAAQKAASTYNRVAMGDPERTAGTIAHYA